jgi:REP element-mobilizing transposase RayT
MGFLVPWLLCNIWTTYKSKTLIVIRSVFHIPTMGGEFWTDGYFVNTISKFGDESTISRYVRDQGIEKDYTVLHESKQLAMF